MQGLAEKSGRDRPEDRPGEPPRGAWDDHGCILTCGSHSRADGRPPDRVGVRRGPWPVNKRHFRSWMFDRDPPQGSGGRSPCASIATTLSPHRGGLLRWPQERAALAHSVPCAASGDPPCRSWRASRSGSSCRRPCLSNVVDNSVRCARVAARQPGPVHAGERGHELAAGAGGDRGAGHPGIDAEAGERPGRDDTRPRSRAPSWAASRSPRR